MQPINAMGNANNEILDEKMARSIEESAAAGNRTMRAHARYAETEHSNISRWYREGEVAILKTERERTPRQRLTVRVFMAIKPALREKGALGDVLVENGIRNAILLENYDPAILAIALRASLGDEDRGDARKALEAIQRFNNAAINGNIDIAEGKDDGDKQGA